MSEAESLVRRFYTYLSEGDTVGLGEILDARWESIPRAAGVTGPGAESYAPAVRWLHSVLSELTIVPQEIIVSGHTVGVRLRGSAVHSGELLGVPATGKPVSYDAFDFHRIADGKIRETRHLEDFFAIAVQIGAFPTPSTT